MGLRDQLLQPVEFCEGKYIQDRRGIAVIAHPAEVIESVVLLAFDRVIEAEKTAGIGSLVVIDRDFQKRAFVDLTA